MRWRFCEQRKIENKDYRKYTSGARAAYRKKGQGPQLK